MKVTIAFDGNSIDDLFDVCQYLADNTWDETPPEDIDFSTLTSKPTVEVEYDIEDEEESDEEDYDGELVDEMRKYPEDFINKGE